MARDGNKLVHLKAHVARPLAAGGAALADVINVGVEHDLAVSRTAVMFRVVAHQSRR
jgi:hypothetical protein